MIQVINDLQKLYDTAGPYFLSDFYKPGGEQRLHEFLTSVYQPEFKHNFRIVIVQDCVDEYHYQDLPGRAVCTLQKYASQIDISNFFILILSGNTQIDQELDHARKLYSTDTLCIQSQFVHDLMYERSNNKKSDTFCVLPWVHLYVGPDGNVLPCCVADQQHPMGNINEQSVDSIVTSEKFNQLRHNMLNGNRVKECSRCYQQEDSGISSPRVYHNTKWSDRITQYNPNGSIDQFEPLYLDLRLNNICNLKCRMCSGYFSSAIAQEEQKLFGNSKHSDSQIVSEQKDMALKKLLKYLPYCEKIYFAGGEPLLTGEHYKILNALIECNNTDLEIVYNTNFTTLSYKNVSVVDLWKQFSNVTIGASLDAMGLVAEYVRHGTKWLDIESNLKLVRSHCQHVVFTVTSTAGFLNVSSLIELQRTWHENNVVDISNFSVTVMVGPDHLTLGILPAHHKERLEQKIKSHIDWCQQNQAMALAEQWESVLKYMFNADSSHHLSKFKQLTNQMDQYRQESFRDVFPEYHDLI
jgi:radical SAM protein with 4Fe4S-binding SPASM domain